MRILTGPTRGLAQTLHSHASSGVAVAYWWTTDRIRYGRENRDRGDILQTVIITAALAAAAILIVAIIVGKARSAANNIKTQ
jgi:hypothetical protein